jgi:hypothetical protein
MKELHLKNFSILRANFVFMMKQYKIYALYRRYMKSYLFIFFLCLIDSELAFSQSDFRPGYIIQLNGDTVYGEIDYRGDLQMGKKCSFRPEKEETVTVYTPGDIAAFRFTDSKFFVSKNVKGANYFLEFLINGKINIYYLRDEVKEYYFLEKQGLDIVEIPYQEGIRDVLDPGSLTSSPYDHPLPHYYSTTKHIGLLKVYMQDADNFESRIEKVKKPDHNSLIHLAEDYHNNVCKDESCIIYERKVPAIKIHPQLVVGLINYENVMDLVDKYYLSGGLIIHMWLPRTNEKLFFKTGLIISEIAVDNEKGKLFKIPVQLEYQFPMKVIRPKLAIGVNLYTPFYQSVAFGGGVNIKLIKSLFLSIDSDIDFNTSQFPLWPKDLLSYSLVGGFYYAF